MRLKRFLATSGLCGILALGAASLTGCEPGMEAIRPTQTEEFYPQLENRVYNLVDGFSRQIPTGFVRFNDKDSYYESTLKMPAGEDPRVEDASGAGRFVTKDSGKINAGYFDAEEVKAMKRTGDTRHLKRVVGFTRQFDVSAQSLGYVSDIISFMEGHEGVMYVKMEGIWRRKSVTMSTSSNVNLGGLEGLRALPRVSEEQVRKYVGLAERLDATYFQRR